MNADDPHLEESQFAKETSLTRQTVYPIKNDPAAAEAALSAWGL